MTLKELKTFLSQIDAPDDTEVLSCGPDADDFTDITTITHVSTSDGTHEIQINHA